MNEINFRSTLNFQLTDSDDERPSVTHEDLLQSFYKFHSIDPEQRRRERELKKEEKVVQLETFVLKEAGPKRNKITENLVQYNLQKHKNIDVFCSRMEDAPDKGMIVCSEAKSVLTSCTYAPFMAGDVTARAS
jgi:hypothetical protein